MEGGGGGGAAVTTTSSPTMDPAAIIGSMLVDPSGQCAVKILSLIGSGSFAHVYLAEEVEANPLHPYLTTSASSASSSNTIKHINKWKHIKQCSTSWHSYKQRPELQPPSSYQHQHHLSSLPSGSLSRMHPASRAQQIHSSHDQTSSSRKHNPLKTPPSPNSPTTTSSASSIHQHHQQQQQYLGNNSNTHLRHPSRRSRSQSALSDDTVLIEGTGIGSTTTNRGQANGRGAGGGGGGGGTTSGSDVGGTTTTGTLVADDMMITDSSPSTTSGLAHESTIGQTPSLMSSSSSGHTSSSMPPFVPQKRAVKRLFKRGLDARQLVLQRQEAVVMKAVEGHDNIVKLLATVEDEESLYLIMEYCELDLYEAITQQSGFPEDVVKEVFGQIADAVIHCHSKGFYHRDLKPENCLISTRDYRIKLTDFGLSTSDNWSTEMGCGSVRYMAPECFEAGHVSSDPTVPLSQVVYPPPSPGYSPAANDVWALGVILLNLLFGKNPWFEAYPTDAIFAAFSGGNPNILKQQFNLTPHFDSILRRTFDLDARRRCTVSELKELVESVPKFVADPHAAAKAAAAATLARQQQIQHQQLLASGGVIGGVAGTGSVLCGPGLVLAPGLPIPERMPAFAFGKGGRDKEREREREREKELKEREKEKMAARKHQHRLSQKLSVSIAGANANNTAASAVSGGGVTSAGKERGSCGSPPEDLVVIPASSGPAGAGAKSEDEGPGGWRGYALSVSSFVTRRRSSKAVTLLQTEEGAGGGESSTGAGSGVAGGLKGSPRRGSRAARA
ncbi:hypothetical protein HDU76_000783, partial [Blyttiomyces sp. JEL0837]